MASSILIGEAVEQVQELYSKGTKSKDSRLSSRYVYSTLIKNRATVLKQQINKGQQVSPWSYQELQCVELESVKTPNTDIVLLRTKFKLPTPILGLDDKMMDSVTTVDGNTIFDKTTYKSSKYSAGKKFTSTKPSFHLFNQFGYINFKSKLKGITIYGLFNDPIEAAKFPSLCNDCTECECKDFMEYSFAIDGDTLNTVAKMAANELIILFSQMREDRSNNSLDDNESENQMIHKPQE